MMDFPRTLAAAKKAKGAEWALADALLEEVGPRGSDARFRDCAAYLAEHGIEYTASYLQQLHQAARNFPPRDRSSWLTPSTAIHAGSPAVVKKATELKRDRGDETPPMTKEIVATRRQVVRHAREQSGAPKMPTRQAIRSSAESATPTALRQAADTMNLELLAAHAKQDAQRFLKGVAGHKLTARERKDLLSDVDEVTEAWAWVRDAVENPLSEEVAEYLGSQ
jgi:hypothetical protein